MRFDRRSKMTRNIVTALAASVAAIVLSTAAAHGAAVVKAPLIATASAPRAKGRAVLALRATSKGSFTVRGRGLAANHPFDVVVGGIKVGAFTTNAHGAGKVTFRTASGKGAAKVRGHKLLLGFDPRGNEVIVRDGKTSDDNLHCKFPGGDDSAAGAFACCGPQHDGAGEIPCAINTPAKCTAEGGTPTSVTSCVPSPCMSSPPPGAVCCIPGSAEGAFTHDDDDGESEIECEDVASVEACVARGGAVVTATSCDPNPCVPARPTTVCCLPESAASAFVGGDDDEGSSQSQCVSHLSASACGAAGGTVVSADSCHPNPCSQTMPPVAVGCCLGGGDETVCRMLTPDACTSAGGTVSGQSCVPDPCSGGEGDHHGHGDEGNHGQQGDQGHEGNQGGDD
jgi:hypothetical protein